MPHKLPLLDSRNAVVIGNGNVAIDCSRILLSSSDKLSKTDVPEYALKPLKKSKVRNVRIFGRRGPLEVWIISAAVKKLIVQASFTIKELRELLRLDGCSSSCLIPDEKIPELMQQMKEADRPKRRILELMLESRTPKNKDCDRSCSIEFFRVPKSIQVDSQGRVESIDVVNALTKGNFIYPPSHNRPHIIQKSCGFHADCSSMPSASTHIFWRDFRRLRMGSYKCSTGVTCPTTRRLSMQRVNNRVWIIRECR